MKGIANNGCFKSTIHFNPCSRSQTSLIFCRNQNQQRLIQIRKFSTESNSTPTNIFKSKNEKTESESTSSVIIPEMLWEEEAPTPKKISSFGEKPIVAIVGRPNVGKSTLFNRLVERGTGNHKQRALVTPIAGTTRDRSYGSCLWLGREFVVVDTAGLVFSNESDELFKHIQEQVSMALQEADVIMFLVDIKSGITKDDEKIARQLREFTDRKKIIVVANKADNILRQQSEKLDEFKRLGLGEVISSLSATHGEGVGDVLDRVIEGMPIPKQEQKNKRNLTKEEQSKLTEQQKREAKAKAKEQKPIRVALVGQPNVGKSTVLNRILKENRAVVSNIPGTTLDPVDETIEWKVPIVNSTQQQQQQTQQNQQTEIEKNEEETNNNPTTNNNTSESKTPTTKTKLITLIDTAGITRQSLHEPGLKKSSVLWSFRTIEKAHVVVLILDPLREISGSIPAYLVPQSKIEIEQKPHQFGPAAPPPLVVVNSQDKSIASHVLDHFKSVVLVVNKWDALDAKQERKKQLEEQVRSQLRFMSYVPVIFASGKSGYNVKKMMDTALVVAEERNYHFTPKRINQIIRDACVRQTPPSKGGKQLRIKFVTQLANHSPPTFVFFVNDKNLVHFSYERYLENTIRDHHAFLGTPLRLLFNENEGKAKQEQKPISKREEKSRELRKQNYQNRITIDPPKRPSHTFTRQKPTKPKSTPNRNNNRQK